MQFLKVFYVLACVAAALACSDPTSPRLALYPDIGDVVTGSAAAALAPDGKLIIPRELGETGEGAPLVDANYASKLARAFNQSYGPAFQGDWTRDRGGPVQTSLLAVNARAFPITSPFGQVPDIGCHPSIIRLFGSFYLTTLDAIEPQVHVAISAQTNEYSVSQSGDLVQPSRTGSDFFHSGISATGTWVITPEQAVAVAADATGALVTEVPRLTRRHVSYSPTLALWRIALDRDIRMRRPDGTTSQARILYVGVLPSQRFYSPRVVQPAQISFSCPRVDGNLVDHGTASFDVAVRDGHPVDFDLVSIVR